MCELVTATSMCKQQVS